MLQKMWEVRQRGRNSLFFNRKKRKQSHIFSFTLRQKGNQQAWKKPELPWRFPGMSPGCSPGLEAPLPQGSLLSLCLTRRENLSALGKSVLGRNPLKHFNCIQTFLMFLLIGISAGKRSPERLQALGMQPLDCSAGLRLPLAGY